MKYPGTKMIVAFFPHLGLRCIVVICVYLLACPLRQKSKFWRIYLRLKFAITLLLIIYIQFSYLMSRSRSGASKNTTKSKARSTSRKQKADEVLFHQGTVVAISGSDSDLNFQLATVNFNLEPSKFLSYSKTSTKALTKSESTIWREMRTYPFSTFSLRRRSHNRFQQTKSLVRLNVESTLKQPKRRSLLVPSLNSRDTPWPRSRDWPRILSVSWDGT